MVDTERTLLYIGVGFLSALFIMKSVRALRPASASSMSMLSAQPLQTLQPKIGCSSCRNQR